MAQIACPEPASWSVTLSLSVARSAIKNRSVAKLLTSGTCDEELNIQMDL